MKAPAFGSLSIQYLQVALVRPYAAVTRTPNVKIHDTAFILSVAFDYHSKRMKLKISRYKFNGKSLRDSISPPMAG